MREEILTTVKGNKYKVSMEMKVDALIIQSRAISPTCRLCTLLTPTSLFKAKVYGASGKNAAFAHLYTEGTFSLFFSRGYYTVKDVSVNSNHEKISESIDSLMASFSLSEIIIKARVIDERLYKLFLSSLYALEKEDEKKVMISFIVHFLTLEGISGDWESCPSCLNKYKEGESLGFSFSLGVAVCSSCDESEKTFILPPQARRYLHSALNEGFEKSLSFVVSEKQKDRILKYLLKTVTIALGEKIQSFSYWE